MLFEYYLPELGEDWGSARRIVADSIRDAVVAVHKRSNEDFSPELTVVIRERGLMSSRVFPAQTWISRAEQVYTYYVERAPDALEEHAADQPFQTLPKREIKSRIKLVLYILTGLGTRIEVQGYGRIHIHAPERLPEEIMGICAEILALEHLCGRDKYGPNIGWSAPL